MELSGDENGENRTEREISYSRFGSRDYNVFVMICAVNLFHYNYRMNSDIASEALLGKEIWERGQLLPDTWYSSTEARVISTPNLAALFYGMTKDMALSMGLSCCCMTALILFSILLQTGRNRSGAESFDGVSVSCSSG